MNFSKAVLAAKNGKRIARKHWNNEGKFVFMRPADVLSADFIIDKVKSLPESVKNFYKNTLFKDEEGCELPKSEVSVWFSEYLCLKNELNSIINGWFPSPEDAESHDWEVLLD